MRRERVGVRQSEYQRIVHDDARGHLGRYDVPSTQGDVRLALQQALHRRLGEVLARQFELNSRAFGTHGPRDPSHDPMRRHACEGDPDQADFALVRCADGCLGASQGFEDVASRAQQGLAARGQGHRPRVAVEQSGSQLAFELHDRPAQRRLRHVQAFGGAPEVQLLRDRQKCPQLSDVHDPHSVCIAFQVLQNR